MKKEKKQKNKLNTDNIWATIRPEATIGLLPFDKSTHGPQFGEDGIADANGLQTKQYAALNVTLPGHLEEGTWLI